VLHGVLLAIDASTDETAVRWWRIGDGWIRKQKHVFSTARSSPSSLHFRVGKGAPDGISLRDEMTVRLGDDFSARRLPDAKA